MECSFLDAAVILSLLVRRALAAWKVEKVLLKEPSLAACGKRLCFGEEHSISCILSSSPVWL